MDGGEIPLQQIVADDRFELRAMRLRELAHDLFELLGPHVLRRRVDEVAHAHAGGEDVAGLVVERIQRQPCRRTRRIAITREPIGAQAPAELDRMARRVVDVAGELPVARGQRIRRVRVGKRIQRIADAEHRAGERAVAAGQRQHRTGRGVVAVREQPLHGRRRLATAPGGEAIAMDQVERTQRCGGVCDGECASRAHTFIVPVGARLARDSALPGRPHRAQGALLQAAVRPRSCPRARDRASRRARRGCRTRGRDAHRRAASVRRGD